MNKEIVLNGRTIEYKLEYKNVKNINVRIVCGGVYVSASRCVGEKAVEAFLQSKAERILIAIEKQSEREAPKQYFTEEELKAFILSCCEKYYPHYEKQGIKKPLVRFRSMVSRWGSCNYVKGILTFTTKLVYAPKDCVEYVIWHEFTHFLVPNHSKKFYVELEKVCPDWKECRKVLKKINIR